MSAHPAAHGWDDARALAASRTPLQAHEIALADAVGAVLAEDAIAVRPVPHYDSSAMDGWAVAGPGPWRVVAEDVLVPGQARGIVTGGPLPLGSEAVVPTEGGTLLEGLLDALRPAAGMHVRRAGEEAPAGTVLAVAGTRLSPAHVAALAIAGIDVVLARSRPRVGFVLTGDEVITAGLPRVGRVRDAFDPLLLRAAEGLAAVPLPAQRVGDDPAAIRDAIDALDDADVLVTVGGTGHSPVDRLREAIEDATTVFDGVAMRPGHPTLLARLPDGRPLLGLPGNPLAAVTALLSFLPPLLEGLTAVLRTGAPTATAAVDLPGRAGGTTLVPCAGRWTGLTPAEASRPNMLRGLAASEVLAVVPPEGVPAGGHARVLPLPW
jgi:molybdopterin molybdotransferase